MREFKKPSLMVLPEVSTQLGPADLLLADASSPARAPQPASMSATVVAKAPVATAVRSRMLVLNIYGNSVPGQEGVTPGFQALDIADEMQPLLQVRADWSHVIALTFLDRSNYVTDTQQCCPDPGETL
ncbi:hypothetical protein [Dactylosporangium sp. NPDC051541]|uniref:hypothetical protein n=1 Tax=Dactylosporangium sp. NPDC051541 TaxID=3363977 RepID=UPI0037912463